MLIDGLPYDVEHIAVYGFLGIRGTDVCGIANLDNVACMSIYLVVVGIGFSSES